MRKVFISYSQDSFEHKAAVKGLADKLRAAGIDCDLDQDEECPQEGWPIWMMRKIQDSEFVLVVCSEGYMAKFNHKSPSGKGVKWEGSIITQELYEAEARNLKFIPVLLHEADARFIPLPLRPYTFYVATQEERYRALCGRLLGIIPVATSSPRANRSETQQGRTSDHPMSSEAVSHHSQFISGDGNIQVGNLGGDLNIQTPKRPIFRFSPARGTIGDNDLLRKRVSELFNRLGEEREKRFGKSAYAVMYRNFKRDFGIESHPWTVVWGWPATAAQAVIDYLSEKYGNTIAGRKERAGKKAGRLPRRPQLYGQEKELLNQLGLKVSSPEVKGALLRYFGVHSHTELTQHNHWLWVCRLRREVQEAIEEGNPEQEDGEGRS